MVKRNRVLLLNIGDQLIMNGKEVGVGGTMNIVVVYEHHVISGALE